MMKSFDSTAQQDKAVVQSGITRDQTTKKNKTNITAYSIKKSQCYVQIKLIHGCNMSYYHILELVHAKNPSFLATEL